MYEKKLPLTSFENAAYSIEQYKNVFFHDELNDKSISSFRNPGLHKIKIYDGLYLDIFTTGLTPKANETQFFLVVFGGAVSDRLGKKAPFFSGKGIARELEMNFLAISDPCLALNDKLALGWYLGFPPVGDLSTKIANILDEICHRFSLKACLVGGSGGGFAAINVGSKMKSAPKCLVWGPQTSVSKFSATSVAEFINSTLQLEKEVNLDSDFYQILDEAGLHHDITSANIDNFSQLIYLQNVSDSHIAKHLAPFVCGRLGDEIVQNVHMIGDEDKLICLCDWGKGHIPPPRHTILKILSVMCRLNDITSTLYNALNDTLSSNRVVTKNLPLDSFQIEAEVSGNVVHGKATIKECDHLYIKYSYYLVINGTRGNVRPYSYNSSFTFDLNKSGLKSVSIIGFALDIFGNKLRKKISIA